ncbi:MAG: response regulator [Nitrospirae bacterium]|nr:response regulator [Nitrospirota bacterium]
MKFLIIDDDDDYRRLTVREVHREFPDVEVSEISKLREFEEIIKRRDFDVVITDLENPELNGMEVCRRIRAVDSYTPVIMLTASGSEELAVEGMKMGLSDYVTKNHLQRLPVSIRECIEKSRVSKEYSLLRMRQTAQFYLTEIFSESDSLDMAVPKLLQAVCRGFGWEIGELWRVNKECNILYLETLWSEPSIYITEFEEISRVMTFSPGEGIPGRVWSSGEAAIWVTDVLHDNHFQRNVIAARLGLHGATAFPITKSGEVTGVMVFFSKKIMPLNDDLCNVMADIGKRIGVFINQKLSEELLRASEQKYRLLLENLPQRIFYKDKNHFYVSCNENFAGDLGITSEDIAGKTDYDLFPKEMAERYIENDDKVLNSGMPDEIEETSLSKGQERIVNTVKTPVTDEKGNIAGVLGIFWDITDRKLAELEKEKLREQLYHTQKIDSLGTLSGGIAHDFNNILTAIIGYGELLKMKLRDEESLIGYVIKILEAADRAAKLTGGLLDFSRKRPVNPVPADLNEVINGIKEMLDRIISENIKFSTVLTPEDCVVLADRNQLGQVLVNLAANARDAMPDGGYLTIMTDIIEIDQSFVSAHGYGKPGSYCMISVSDTGSGIDDETKKRIFEPFFTTKDVGKGTGLGLAIVYGIVKQHNGYINVYSEQGRGTTFSIYLPLIHSIVEKTITLDEACPVCGTETVLLAEDDTAIRGLAEMLLKENGYNVIEAVNGDDAIEKFKENKDRIDLLVLDLIMPEKNGKEVYDIANSGKPGINALFMSGYNRDIIYDKNILEGSVNFILKPFSPLNFLKKLRQVLDHK